MKNKKDTIINAVLFCAVVLLFTYIYIIMFYSPDAPSNYSTDAPSNYSTDAPSNYSTDAPSNYSTDAPSNTQERFGDSSIWFDASTENYLSFTPSTDGTSTDIFTVSFWCKRGNLGSTQYLWGIDETTINFTASDNLSGNLRGTENGNYSWTTRVVFRDPSAWYHIVAAYDSTQSVDTNRFKLYVNGRIQKFSSISYMPQHREMKDTQTHYIGQNGSGNRGYFDGYLADYYMIDGQQLTPSSFGEGEKGDYGGIWKPIEYDGTFGTNGFYLDFDGSELGSKKIIDSSPNQHSITVNG
jgi:hypothetical protein